MTKPTVDIILPCYNPPQNWVLTIIAAFGKIQQDAKLWTPGLIIVNDGSINGIEQKDIDLLKTKIPSLQWISYSQNKGKGYALRKGVKESTGDFLLLTDIDFPYTHNSLMNMVNSLIKNNANVLAGERNTNYYSHTPFMRKMISKFLKFIVKNLLKIKVSDTQCGLKGLSKETKDIFLSTKINRYLYDIEFLWLSGRKHKVEAFPVDLKDNIVFSKMDYRILLTETWNFLTFFFKTLK